MTPTSEQQAILDGFKNTTGNIKVLALAGTGKTSTLLELVKQNPSDTFLYLAFNRVVKEEVENKAKANGLHNLKVKTQNGFCLELARAAGLETRTIKGYLSVKDIISRLKLTGNDRFLAFHASQIMTRFLASADKELSLKHVPKDTEDKIYTNIRRFSARSDDSALKETDKVKRRAVQIAKDLFASFDFKSDVMLHDVYVKLVQLHYKEVPVAEDVVLSDESQDVNPVFSDIVSRMTSRIIAVGDNNQAIYQFRGAQDYLKEMPAESVFSLTQSFRFIPEIANVANVLLEKMTDLRLKGFEDVKEENSSAILCRTNMGCLSEAIFLLGQNKPFSLEGGVDNEGFKMIKDIVSLHNGNISEVQHPDLKGLRSIYDFEKELEDNLLNKEWQTSLRVIDAMGGINAAMGMIEELKASQRKVDKNAVVITTMHKSKGKEWNDVRLGVDVENVFYRSDDSTGRKTRIPIEFEQAPLMEKNLFYVAVTRAKRKLELGPSSRLFEGGTNDTIIQKVA